MPSITVDLPEPANDAERNALLKVLEVAHPRNDTLRELDHNNPMHGALSDLAFQLHAAAAVVTAERVRADYALGDALEALQAVTFSESGSLEGVYERALVGTLVPADDRPGADARRVAREDFRARVADVEKVLDEADRLLAEGRHR